MDTCSIRLIKRMKFTCLLCHLVWMLSLVAINDAQLQEPAYREQLMKVCPKQKTTEQFIDSFEVSSVNQCAVRCVNEKSCKSANVCSSGGSKVCTMSVKYPLTGCKGNTASDNCKYIYSEILCLNGGTVKEGGYCVCPNMYTGEFCERLYYDCAEPGVVSNGKTWIQRGGHPPFMVYCNSLRIHVLKVYPACLDQSNFPLNRTFDEYQPIFTSSCYINGGLETLHTATSQAYYTLILDIHAAASVIRTYYHNFTLASESERYRLDYLSVTGGPDGLAAMKGRPFSAVGNDPEGCAQMHNVAWWYTAKCTAPTFMIYNDNKKVSFIDQTNTLRDYFYTNLYLRFEGLI